MGFVHDRRYPGSRMRFDFHVPSEDKYIEVSSFDSSFKGWEGYMAKIGRKRRHVESVLGSSFEFINRKPTEREQREVLATMDVPVIVKERRHNRPRSYWVGVDWSREDGDIAADAGCSVGTVGLKRHKFAPAGMRAWDMTVRARWSGVDWSLSNRRLARELGRTVGAVSVARARLGIANPHAVKRAGLGNRSF
jgi:hypothetical protein